MSKRKRIGYIILTVICWTLFLVVLFTVKEELSLPQAYGLALVVVIAAASLMTAILGWHPWMKEGP